MRRAKVFSVLLAAAMAVMCSCSDKAEEQKVTQYQTKTQFHYGDGFTLPRDAQMGIYEFEQYSGENKIDALSSVFFSADEKLNASKEELTSIVPTTKLETEDGSKVLVVAENGRFLYHDFDIEPKLPAYSAWETIFPRRFDRKYVRFSEYESADLKTLSDKAQSYLTDCFIAMGLDIQVRPEFAMLYSIEDIMEYDPTNPEPKYYYADICFVIELDDGGAAVKNFRTTEGKKRALEQSFMISVSMYNAERPFEIESLYEPIIPKGIIDERDHIDCDEAIVYLYNKYYANAEKMTLLDAELVYMPYMESYDETVWSTEFVHQPGTVYTAEPYWALYFNIGDMDCIYYVNALNGKIITFPEPRSSYCLDGRYLDAEPIYDIERIYDPVVYYDYGDEEFEEEYEDEEEQSETF